MQRGRCHGKRELAGLVLSITANKRRGNTIEEREPAPLTRRALHPRRLLPRESTPSGVFACTYTRMPAAR